MSSNLKSAGGRVATDSAAQSGVQEGSSFFSLNCKYHIAPGARLVDLLNDCNCLLESGIGALEEHGCDDFDHTQWAALYMLRQAHGVYARIYELAYASAASINAMQPTSRAAFEASARPREAAGELFAEIASIAESLRALLVSHGDGAAAIDSPARALVCQIGALADSSAVALGNVSMHGGFEEWLLSPVGLSAYEAVRGSA